MERTEYQVTGQRCPDGYVRRFPVSNFPNHNYVGILTQYVPQCLGKPKADFSFNLNLINAWHFVFDRIFTVMIRLSSN